MQFPILSIPSLHVYTYESNEDVPHIPVPLRVDLVSDAWVADTEHLLAQHTYSTPRGHKKGKAIRPEERCGDG